MAKDDKEAKAEPESTEPAAAAVAKAPEPAGPIKIKAMNVSATALTIGPHHEHFAPGTVAMLTQEEFDRFSAFGLVSRQP
jgi:hypothetical protein